MKRKKYAHNIKQLANYGNKLYRAGKIKSVHLGVKLATAESLGNILKKHGVKVKYRIN